MKSERAIRKMDCLLQKSVRKRQKSKVLIRKCYFQKKCLNISSLVNLPMIVPGNASTLERMIKRVARKAIIPISKRKKGAVIQILQ